MNNGPFLSLYPGDVSLSKVKIYSNILKNYYSNQFSKTTSFSGYKSAIGYDNYYVTIPLVNNHASLFYTRYDGFRPMKYVDTQELIANKDDFIDKSLTIKVYKTNTSIETKNGTLSSNNLYYTTVKLASSSLLVFPSSDMESLLEGDGLIFFNVSLDDGYNGDWYLYPDHINNSIHIYIKFPDSSDVNIPEGISGTFEYKELSSNIINNSEFLFVNDLYSSKWDTEIQARRYKVRVNCLSTNKEVKDFMGLIFYPEVKYQTFTTNLGLKCKTYTELKRYCIPDTALLASYSIIDTVRDIKLIDGGYPNCPINVYELHNKVLSEDIYEKLDKLMSYTIDIVYQGQLLIYIDLGLTINSCICKNILTNTEHVLIYDNGTKSIITNKDMILGVYSFILSINKPDSMVNKINFISGDYYTDDISLANINSLSKGNIMVIGEEENIDIPLTMANVNPNYNYKILIYSEILRDVIPNIIDLRNPTTKIDLPNTIGNSPLSYIFNPIKHDEYISISKQLTESWDHNKWNNGISDKYPTKLSKFVDDNVNAWSKTFIVDKKLLDSILEYELTIIPNYEGLILFDIWITSELDDLFYLRIPNPRLQKSSVLLSKYEDGIYFDDLNNKLRDNNYLITQRKFRFVLGVYPGFFDYEDGVHDIEIHIGNYNYFFEMEGIPTKIIRTMTDLDITTPGSYGAGGFGMSTYGGEDEFNSGINPEIEIENE